MPADDSAPQARRSLLQVMILTSLHDKPAPTIAALASRLNKTRPAVSRSVQALKDDGFVMRESKIGWMLTEAGKQEVEAVSERLAKTTAASANDLFKRIAASNIAGLDGTNFGQYNAAVRQLESVARYVQAMPPLDAPLLRMLADAQRVMPPYLTAAKVIPIDLPWQKNLMALVTGMNQAQGITAQLAQLLPLHQPLAALDIISINSASIASVLREANHVGHMMNEILGQASFAAPIPRILSEWRLTVNRYTALQEDRLHLVSTTKHLGTLELTLPTIALSEYSRSVRHYVEATVGDHTTAEPQSAVNAVDADTRGLGEQLEPLLVKVDPRLVTKRRGIWDALSEHNDDGPCQAAHSARELLRLTLDVLAPEEVFEGGSPTRRQRVNHILKSKSHADYIDAMAGATNAMYGRLSNMAHSIEQARLIAIATVSACEALLLDVLLAAIDPQ